MKLLWSKHLSVGNVIIDSEHRNLISLINDVICAIEMKCDSALTQAFEQLEQALCVHFANEEKIAQAIGFDFSKHRSAQQYALKELLFLKNELAGGNGLWSENAVEHFTRFLETWMIDEHITKLDMQMSPALQAYGYEFYPNLKE